jgi:hypothetical protein
VPELWQRRKGESAQAAEAARTYIELRAERSIAAVGQKLGKSRVLQERWSVRWDWVNRAAAFDRWEELQLQKALEAAARAQALAWQKRDELIRIRKFDQAEKQLKKIDQMLEFPLATVVTETTEEDGAITRRTTIRPAKWNFDTVHRMSRSAYRQAQEAIRNEGSINEASSELRDVQWEIEDYTTEPVAA